MGRSTTQQLIQRAKSINKFNNSGVSNDTDWVTHINSALVDMTEDLNLTSELTINVVPNQRLYPLPDDYYALLMVTDLNVANSVVAKARNINQQYPPGWWVHDRGDRYEIDFYKYTSPVTLTLHYQRYPKALTVGGIAIERPEVSTIGEDALCYLSVCKALLNNNQVNHAAYFLERYKEEKGKIKTASTRARG